MLLFSKKKKKKKTKKTTNMALVTYVTLLVGRTTIHWHLFQIREQEKHRTQKNIKERNQNTKHKTQNTKHEIQKCLFLSWYLNYLCTMG